MADYVPNTDADFNTWQDNLYKYASDHLAELRLTAADLAPITAARSGWTTTFADHISDKRRLRSRARLKALLAKTMRRSCVRSYKAFRPSPIWTTSIAPVCRSTFAAPAALQPVCPVQAPWRRSIRVTGCGIRLTSMTNIHLRGEPSPRV